MKNLDFMIIGAQKCATTTLYHHLKFHPCIQLPADKEAPYFNGEAVDTNSYQAFIQQNYPDTNTDEPRLKGKASPQYMSSAAIPERIHQLAPDIKLIALLKNPIKRAFSHYQMCVRRGTETRSFDQAVQDSLDLNNLANGRVAMAPRHETGYESEADFYIPWGEYGRILDSYFTFFKPEQILVLFTEDLQHEPQHCVDQVLRHIGLATGYTPPALGEVFHKGGGQPIIPPSMIKTVVNLPVIRHLYQKITPQQRKKLRYWFDQRNIQKAQLSSELAPETQQKVDHLFSLDIQRLNKHGIHPPWALQLNASKVSANASIKANKAEPSVLTEHHLGSS